MIKDSIYKDQLVLYKNNSLLLTTSITVLENVLPTIQFYISDLEDNILITSNNIELINTKVYDDIYYQLTYQIYISELDLNILNTNTYYLSYIRVSYSNVNKVVAILETKVVDIKDVVLNKC